MMPSGEIIGGLSGFHLIEVVLYHSFIFSCHDFPCKHYFIRFLVLEVVMAKGLSVDLCIFLLY
jgi:hypothetical protein